MSAIMLKKFNLRWLGIKILLPAFIAVLPLVILEIWSVNRLATLGQDIAALDKTKQALVLENQGLENEIAQKSSLSLVESKSRLLGFQKIRAITQIQPPNLALNR